MLELLAPAQTLEHGKIAIDCGADAVYIGASNFGARKNASNSIDDIKELVDYAHFFNSKVYVTVNTILTDDELIQAQKLINDLYEIKVDAIIVQDMGLLNVDLPPIPIFASTQCDNRLLEKIKFFEKIGIKRVILARELSIEQIREICENTSVEIETFIHGALCVSYSGQCYLSASIGNRSANRGECAQPCRKKYSLVDRKTGKVIVKDKHLLSLKDFNASNHIEKLAEIGVTSFKIEGRLKDINYVKNVVLYYRNLIDTFGAKSSSGKVLTNFVPDINKTFNRGYTDYFLVKRKFIHNFDTPKFMGEKLGKVKYVNRNKIVLDTKIEVSPQDGLCYMENGELQGGLVNKVIKDEIYFAKPVKIPIGTEIYRNVDAEFNRIMNNAKIKRVIQVDLTVFDDYILAKDEDNNTVKLGFDYKEIAENQENMKRLFFEQMNKTGESNIEFRNIDVKLSKFPFIKVSQINEIRRNLIELLIEIRLKSYKKCYQQPLNLAKYPLQEVDYRGNVYNNEAKKFYENCNCKITELALEKTREYKNKELMRTKHCLKFALGRCGDKSEWILVDSQNKNYSLVFDCKNCEMVLMNN